METNPIAPRQRNRRADRQQAQAEPAQQQARPATPAVPVQQPAPQPIQTVQPPQQVQPMQRAYPQNPYQQHPTSWQQPAAPIQPQRPRVLEQSRTVQSGWQQPSLPPQNMPRSQSPRREAPQEKTQPKQEPRTDRKLPGWLTTAMTLSFIAALALVAVYYLMQAYLVTEENKRVAAYEAILSNYHVTEQADGSLRVTWQEEIERYAAQYNLQPAFVTAIIRQESSFRTNAESSVGARGLMQMMPDTAEWIAGKLDDDAYTFDSMWEGETNIRYGCWYLGYLSRLFHGDPVLVSAAYHAGQTTVTQWLSDPNRSADGISLDVDRLSDGPTKQYIGRVTQTYGIYQSLLYPDQAFGAADGLSADGAAASAGDR